MNEHHRNEANETTAPDLDLFVDANFCILPEIDRMTKRFDRSQIEELIERLNPETTINVVKLGALYGELHARRHPRFAFQRPTSAIMPIID